MNWFKEKFEELELFYAGTGLRFSFKIFLGFFLGLAIVLALLLALLHLPLVTSVIALLAVFSLAITVPVTMRNNRIAEIEEALPDALKHLALVLKAGGTTESALEELSTAHYGPLSEDTEYSLKKLHEGKPFDEVFVEQARRSGSLLFQRTAMILVDAKKAGAGLAEVMTQIAEDARDLLHIKRERYSKTMMHVIFLITSSLILSPFIFGFAISIVNYINIGIASAMPSAPVSNLCTLHLILIVFIMFINILTSLALGIIREGKFVKYILYAPLMVLGALLVFEVGKWFSVIIVGGKAIIC